MNNRFVEMDDLLSGRKRQRHCRCAKANGNGHGSHLASMQSSWSTPFSATDRALVILIENGGVDLGLPTVVDRLWSLIPGADVIPDSYKTKLITFLREKITEFTDNLLETAELSLNRYAAAKPEFYGDVSVLRDSTASYTDLKDKLISLSRAGKIIDVIILTHGSDDYISVTGGVDSSKIRAMKTEYGKPLSIRSVYMMNCVGSSLNNAWLDAGAKISSGAMKNNYLPEPTTFFFWKSWKEGEAFDTAATSAYRKTINLMNDAVRGFISSIPVPGTSMLAGLVDFANFDFVKDSAPVVQGQHGLNIGSDDLTFAQSVVSSLVTTVLPASALKSFRVSRAYSDNQTHTLSANGVELIKGFEGFIPKLYNDPVGHCTVGYGTLLHKGNCDGRDSEQPYLSGVTQEKAAELLTQEASGFEKTISDKVIVPLNQNQFDALVSFVYNVGPDNFQKSTLLKVLNQGKYEAVPGELKKWTKGRQNGQLVELPGLVKRRAAEADLFQKAEAATAKSFSEPGSPAFTAVEFWAVWCVNENCFLPEIYLQESSARSAAQKHIENTTRENMPPHRAVAMPIRMGSDLNVQAADAGVVAATASIAYGQDITVPETNIQVVRGPEKFELPNYGSSMGNVSFNVTPPPATGTQTQTGTLSVNCSVVNQSGTAVEMVCSFLRRGTAERSSQVLTANFNGEVEFAFPNVDRNNTYSIVLSLNTSDSTIKVSGTFTVMMTDQR